MKTKIIIIVINIMYLLATVAWAICEKSIESFVAVVGGVVSLTSFFVANGNSFSIKHKEKNEQKIDNEKATIERQINIQKGNYTENN